MGRRDVGFGGDTIWLSAQLIFELPAQEKFEFCGWLFRWPTLVRVRNLVFLLACSV